MNDAVDRPHVVQNGDGSQTAVSCEEYQEYVEHASWYRKAQELANRLEQEQLDRLTEHHLVVNIEHWSGLEAINSIGAPVALEKINAECRAHLELSEDSEHGS